MHFWTFYTFFGQVRHLFINGHLASFHLEKGGATHRSGNGFKRGEIQDRFLKGSGDVHAGQDVRRKDKAKRPEFFQNRKIRVQVRSFSFSFSGYAVVMLRNQTFLHCCLSEQRKVSAVYSP